MKVLYRAILNFDSPSKFNTEIRYLLFRIKLFQKLNKTRSSIITEIIIM
jgi:hypothetical protein